MDDKINIYIYCIARGSVFPDRRYMGVGNP